MHTNMLEQITKVFRRGLITDDDRYDAVTNNMERKAERNIQKRLIATH